MNSLPIIKNQQQLKKDKEEQEQRDMLNTMLGAHDELLDLVVSIVVANYDKLKETKELKRLKYVHEEVTKFRKSQENRKE